MTKARDLANAGTALTAVSATELGYLDGVTSAVQTQIDGKVASSLVDAKGDLLVGSADNTLSRLAVSDDGSTIVADSAATTGLRWQGNYAAGKNRIINGGMTIDQRNAGASVSVSSSLYTLDRWRGFNPAGGGVYSVQQDSSAPAGFSNSLKVTVTTAATSLVSTDNYSITQEIEGYNVADFALGSASAKTFTLSFWVRSSLTGTFGGSFKNQDNNRSYPFTYSISVADTWEKKSITIEGETSGTWNKTTGLGLRLFMALGTGASRQGTAGVWGTDNYTGATGQTQIIETLNATWYITGVQVEIGSVATAFTPAAGTIQGEIGLCQRYYYRTSAANTTTFTTVGNAYSTTNAVIETRLPVTMRVKPTSVDFSTLQIYSLTSGGQTAATNVTINAGNGDIIEVIGTVSSGLTSGHIVNLRGNGAGAYLGFSAEL